MTVKRKKKKSTKHDNKTPSDSLAFNGISSVYQKEKGLRTLKSGAATHS